ncbi:MAG: sulfate adenylyltransferase subunit CysN [Planctomycetota bacterium]
MTGAMELLEQNEKKDLLRFVTAGSVDDGKSTLIGRLLFESKGIYEDQLESVAGASKKVGTTGEDVDLALVTDGLQAEREQGITIDVAYRYFSTPKRKFIIADSPGHEQYTRNMATGASTASLAIILIDAANGVLTQSKRHSFIASLLGIPHILIAVNKMDLVDYSEDVFKEIREDFTDFSAKLKLGDVTFIPISALKGDNVVERSERMPWYQGGTLLNHLENVHIASDRNLIDMRMPVQYVCRPNSEFRGYMGTVASGTIRPGDTVVALPSGRSSKVTQVLGVDGAIQAGFPPLPVTVTLEDEIDISRGDMLVHEHNVPRVDRTFEAMLVWMHDDAMVPGKQYMIKHTTKLTPGVISNLMYQVDVNTLRRSKAAELKLNEIGRCEIELARPVAYDPYEQNRTTGSFIVIDRLTHNTVGAGMIIEREPKEMKTQPSRRVTEIESKDITSHASSVDASQREAKMGHKPATLWLTGLTGSGKTTIGYALEKRLYDAGCAAAVLDGENFRMGMSKDLGFGADDRAENMRRAAEAARLLNDAGLIAVCSFLSPYEEDRQRAREVVGPDRFIEVYLSAPVEVCKERAAENIYGRAESGEIKRFSGITAPYHEPKHPELTLPTHELDVDECVGRIVALLQARGIIRI